MNIQLGVQKMSTNYYCIVVIFQTKSGKESAFKEFLTSIINIAMEHPGCVKHDLHQSIDDPSKFMFYEVWNDKQSHEQHVARDEVKGWRARLDSYLEVPYEVSVWELLSV